MDCPVCHEAMIVLELEEVEIDHCVECGGIWLDDGELELLLGEAEEKQQFMETLKAAAGHAEKARRCPMCSKKMHKVLCGEGQAICIDQCSKHGDFSLGRLDVLQPQRLCLLKVDGDLLDLASQLAVA